MGSKAAIILSSPPSQFLKLKALTQQYNIRLLGPNSLRILAPWQQLNASFSPIPILKGKLAFISQSAAVSNIILDWAQQRKIGFSYFIAQGNTLDIDIDDLLDFLARANKTSTILLYISKFILEKNIYFVIKIKTLSYRTYTTGTEIPFSSSQCIT
ncbi:hypothetical protein ARSQ2_00006 [Arsenophonus endosymbiont of Bemisia tabaci Q2]|nr:hypothetical protein ARSQ2_00006 [Arsenophonus endosymbiont of Bemisia tabaci Q2]